MVSLEKGETSIFMLFENYLSLAFAIHLLLDLEFNIYAPESEGKGATQALF